MTLAKLRSKFASPVIRGLTAAGLLVGVMMWPSVAEGRATAPPECVYFDADFGDSGTATFNGQAYRCPDTFGPYYLVQGTLYDTACDNRAAEIDLWTSGSRTHTVNPHGCGTHVGVWEILYPPLSGGDTIWGRLRACNNAPINRCSSFVNVSFVL